MAKEKDDDADREPESKGKIHERRQRKAEISAGTEKPKGNSPTTRATFGFRPSHQKPDRYLATFSGPVGAPQTPTDSRGALLNRIAVFSITVIGLC